MATPNPFLQSPFQTLIAQQEEARPLPGVEQVKEAQPLPDLTAAAPVPAQAGISPKLASPSPAAAPGTDNLLPPEPLRPLFEATASHFKVPVNVLMAIAHQESRYNPDATNKETGASGMAQYIDATAKSLGINARDPNEAVPAAAMQLRERLDKGMSVEDAVKEHFAGPDRKKWGEKTAAYGAEVLAKAGQIGKELYGDTDAATEPATAGTPAPDQDTRQNQFSPTRMGKADYEAEFRKLNPRASDAAVRAAMAQYDTQVAAKTSAAGNRVQGKFKQLQSPEAMFDARLNARLQGVQNGVAPQLPGNQQPYMPHVQTPLARLNEELRHSLAVEKGEPVAPLPPSNVNPADIEAELRPRAGGPGAIMTNAVTGLFGTVLGAEATGASMLGMDNAAKELDAARAQGAEAARLNGGDTIVGKTANLAGAIAPAMVSGGAGLTAELAGNAGLFGVPAFRDTYKEQKAKGASEAIAIEHALAAAGINTALPMIAPGGSRAITKALGAADVAGLKAAGVQFGQAAGEGAGFSVANTATHKAIDAANGIQTNDPWVDGKGALSDAVAFTALRAGHMAPHAVDAAMDKVAPGYQVGRALQEDAGNLHFDPASARGIAADRLSAQNYDPRTIAPQDTARAPGDVGPSPMTRTGPAPAQQESQQNQELANGGAPIQADSGPASGPLTATVESAAPAAPRAGSPSVADQLRAIRPPAGPLEAAIQDAAEQHAANPAPLPEVPQEAPQPPALESLPLEELRAQLKQVAGQAKANPDQRQELMKQRQAIEKEIGARAKQAKADSKPAEEPLKSGPFEDMAAANKMMLCYAEQTGQPHEVVGSEGKFEVKPIRGQGDGINPAGAARGTDGHGRGSEPAGGVGGHLDAGRAGTGNGTGARAGGEQPAPAQERTGDAAGNRVAADGAADAQPALSEPQSAAQNIPKNIPAAHALKNPYHTRQFPDQAKAEAFLDKQGAREQFEAVQTGPVRWQVKPRAAPAPAAEQAKLPTRDTRGTGVRFHGSSRPLPDGRPNNEYAMNGDSRNIYGQGFYTTDAADISEGYMKKGKGGSPTLYEISERGAPKLYDMEQPMTPEIRAMAERAMGDAFPEQDIDGKPIATLRALFDEYRDDSQNNGLTRDDVQETLDAIRYNLENDGYHGYSHIGGLKTGKKPHEVRIYWTPEDHIEVSPSDLAKYKESADVPQRQEVPEEAPVARGAESPPQADTAAAKAVTTGVTDTTTGSEWAKAREAVRPNVAQSRFTGASASEAVGNHTRLQHLLYGVTDAARQRIKDAQDGKVKLSRDEVDDLMSRINMPVSHQDVVAKAIAEGKPVPESVRAEYPELAASNESKAEQPQPAAVTSPAPTPKAKTGGDRARERVQAENPFLAFVAEHGVHIDERSDTGGQGGRAGMVLVPGFGSVYRKAGARLDELAGLAHEAGFLTDQDMQNPADNGGTRKLAEMIQRAVHNKELIGRAESPEASLPDADHQLMAEAHALGIDVTGKSADEVYDAVLDAHAAEYTHGESDIVALALHDADIPMDGGKSFDNLTEEQIDEIFGIRTAGQAESRGRQDQEGAAGTARGADEGTGEAGQGEDLLSTYTPAELRAREEAATAVAKAKESDTAKADAAAKQARDDKDVRARQAASADEFQLGQDAHDSLAGQKDIFGQDEGVRYSVSGDQTDTPAFKKWFGASKIVNPDGTPRVLYHGTNADVSELKSKGELHPGLPWTRGIYFTADPKYASRYADREGANVMPVYVKMENPKIVTDSGFKTASISKEQIDQLRAEGHDGIINHADDEYIVFDGKQVKSAIGNDGKFSQENADIRYSVSGERDYGKEINDLEREADGLLGSYANDTELSKALSRLTPEQRARLDEIDTETTRLRDEQRKAKKKPNARPSDDRLQADYASPEEVPADVRAWVRRNASTLFTDASDAVRWSRIENTLDHERYPEGELTIYRAVADGGEIRPGDWVTTDRSYAEGHMQKSLNGRGRILEEVVDGADVLVSPTGNHEEAIYAPRDLSGKVDPASPDIRYSTKGDVPQEKADAYLKAVTEGRKRDALRILHEVIGVEDVDATIDRGGAHTPSGPEDGSPLYDVSKNGTYPEDVYSHKGLHYYGTGEDKMDREAYAIIKKHEAYPNMSVTIYRAVHKSEKGVINPGDWVTTVREYAKEHGEGALNGDFKIIKKTVMARDIFTSGDSWLEWGYHPQEFKPEVPKGERKLAPLQDRIKSWAARSADDSFSVAHPMADAAPRAVSPLVQSLADKGAIVLHQDASTLPVKGKAPAGVQALTTADGTIHVVANALGDNARGIILHEAFHAGTKALIGSAAWDGLNTRLGALYRQGEQTSGAARAFWDAARARVETAKAKGAVAAGMEHEEFGAYAIEEYAKAPTTVRRWVDDLVGAVKAWALRRFGKQLGDVTPAQLTSLAKLALLDRATMAARERSMQPSPESMQPSFSADSSKTIEVDGQRRPIKNSRGKLIAEDMHKQMAFHRWFSESKAVDPQGRPLTLYHGTNVDFAEFDKAKIRSRFDYSFGFHFTTRPTEANRYAERENSSVMPVYVKAENPLIIDTKHPSPSMEADLNKADIIHKLVLAKRAGTPYDSVIIRRDRGDEWDGWNVIVFKPEQIKSAVGNDGSFSGDTPDIRYSTAGAPTTPTVDPTMRERLARTIARPVDMLHSAAHVTKMLASPMDTGSSKAMAWAKDFASQSRKAQDQWTAFDTVLRENYTDQQLTAMWHAADQENDLRRDGKTSRTKGLNALPADQRETVELLHAYGEQLWDRAKRAGLVAEESEGVHYWTPRVAAMIQADGSVDRIKSSPGEFSNDAKNLRTSANSTKHRKYDTTAEAEAAGKAGHGDEFEFVKNIRVMPMAMAQLEKAVAGRTLVNQVKVHGQVAGVELVRDSEAKDFETFNHPALKNWRPISDWKAVDPAELAAKGYDVRADGVYKADGTKLKTYRVENGEAQKPQPVLDSDGKPRMESFPLFIHKDFVGPLHAVLDTGLGNKYLDKGYRGLMNLKSAAMSVIMISPATHNAVIWGKAMPSMVTAMGWKNNLKNLATAGAHTYIMGHQWRKDRALMNDLLDAGLVPMGGRGGNPDVEAIANGLKPGRSYTAKALGYVMDMAEPVTGPVARVAGKAVDAVAGPAGRGIAATGRAIGDNLAGRAVKGIGETVAKTGGVVKRMGTGDGIRENVDDLGHFWHQTLLWDRIADMQVGMAVQMRNHLMDNGVDQFIASRIAAHFANRYAGAIPPEEMSRWAHAIGNAVLFSKSFTGTNLAAMKDPLTGLPASVRAQIREHFAKMNTAMGKIEIDAYDAANKKVSQAQAITRRKATSILLVDFALMAAVGSITTAYLKGQDYDEFKRDLMERAKKLGAKIKDDPTYPIPFIGHPFEALESLSQTHDNPHGKQDRVRLSEDGHGNTYYLRLPVGKTVEEMKSYSNLSTTSALIDNKLSPLVKSVVESKQNKDFQGRTVYDEDAHYLKQAAQVAGHIIKAHLPYDDIVALKNIVGGQKDKGDKIHMAGRDWSMDEAKLLGTATGLSVSKLSGGDAVAEMRYLDRQRAAALHNVLPDVRDAMRRGDDAEAEKLLEKAGLDGKEISRTLKNLDDPSKISKGRMKRFERHATDEQMDRLDKMRK